MEVFQARFADQENVKNAKKPGPNNLRIVLPPSWNHKVCWTLSLDLIRQWQQLRNSAKPLALNTKSLPNLGYGIGLRPDHIPQLYSFVRNNYTKVKQALTGWRS